MSDKIRVWVKDMDSGEVLEELGTCLTDSPNRAVQMYDQDEAWAEKGYSADIAWEWVDETKRAAATLGRKTSEKKAATSRENGKRGGRPSTKKINPVEVWMDGGYIGQANEIITNGTGSYYAEDGEYLQDNGEYIPANGNGVETR